MGQFLPVKILEEEFATRLFKEGEVYMRSIHEFGSWGVFDASKELKNNYRADIHSGVCEVFATPEDSEFFRATPDPPKSYMKHLCYVDNSDIQYFNIYSLICLDYKNGFHTIDPQMRQFGNKAIVFTDFNTFLGRLNNALIDRYHTITFLCNKVEWYDFDQTRKVDPLFWKYKAQEYQNELRIAFCQLQEGNGPLRAIKKDYEAVTIKIGSIQDIACMVETDQLISGDFDFNNSKLIWPSDDTNNHQSIYDRRIALTKRQMGIYSPKEVKPMFSI